MSTGLFSSRHKSLRNLRKLVISAPLNPIVPNLEVQSPRTSSPVVILRAKHTFIPLADPELAISKGEHAKLVDRLGNGWLKVQVIDRLEQGLVPALYFDIVINDPQHPITPDWLNTVKTRLPKAESVLSATITNVFSDPSHGVWYRLDAEISTGKRCVCCFTYEIFETLHRTLVAKYGQNRLPVFPLRRLAAYARSSAQANLDSVTQDRIAVMHNLENYLQKVLMLNMEYVGVIFLRFVMEKCPSKLVLQHDECMPSTEEVVAALRKGLKVIQSASQSVRKISFIPTAPLPSVDTPTSPVLKSPKESSHYFSSNLKYLSYLNQSSAPSTPRVMLMQESYQLPKPSPPVAKSQPAEPAPRVELPSSPTLESLSSLIDYYNCASIGAEDMLETESQANKTHSRCMDDSSTDRSRFSGSDSLRAREPVTPLLGNELMCSVVNSFDVDQPNILPLTPQMHPGFAAANGKDITKWVELTASWERL